MQHARWKLALLFSALIAISFTRVVWLFAIYSLVLLLVALLDARISLRKLLRRACSVAAFLLLIALLVFVSGDHARALLFLERSILSAIAALIFISTTQVSDFIRALEWYRVPQALLLTIQFLYRYLFLVSDQARRMRFAAASRGGFRYRSSAGALGVLFLRSWERADLVHAAMLARGFTGKFPP